METEPHGLDPKLLSEIIRFSHEVKQARSVLGPALAHQYLISQLRGLISQIYFMSGTGAPPASAGKFELGRRWKLDYES